MKNEFKIVLMAVWIVVHSNSAYGQAPNWEWALQWGSSDGDFSNDVVLDPEGNIYITGDFREIMDFDPGPGVFNLTPVSEGDVFIAKLDPDGNFLWAQNFGGWAFDYGESIALDNEGNVYVSGIFRGSVDFNAGPGNATITSDGDDMDLFIIKLNNDGIFQWVRNLTQVNSVANHGLSVDGDTGNVFVSGSIEGTMDLDPGQGIHNYYAIDDEHSFLLKLDTDGMYIWSRAVTAYVSGLDIDDSNGDIYLTGTFGNTVDFDLGFGEYFMSSAQLGTSDAFILRLDSIGNFVWARGLHGLGNQSPFDIQVTPFGEVITAGRCDNAFDMDPGIEIQISPFVGYFDSYVSKLDTTGNYIWGLSFGSSEFDGATSIAYDPSGNGNIFVSGLFYGSIDLDPGLGSDSYTSPIGSYTGYITKFNELGDYVWSKTTLGVLLFDGAQIAVDSGHSVISTRAFNSTEIVFDSDTLNRIGDSDVFIAKLGCSTSATHYINACYSYTSPSSKYYWQESGVYQDTLLNCSECDSVVTMILNIHENSYVEFNVAACNAFASPNGNYIWMESGVFNDTIANSLGCDSVMIFNVSIYSETYSSIDVVDCTSYESPSGNYIWTNSGTYLDTITNFRGCDSIITIQLTLNSTYSEVLVDECIGYTSPSGEYYWNEDGLYMDTIPNAVGCDSIITIFLSINNTHSSFTWTACFGIQSPSGDHVWTATGAYQDTLMNTMGCDSVITVYLTIQNINTNVIQNNTTLNCVAAGANYQWLDCLNDNSPIVGATNQSFVATQNGSYAAKVTLNGCIDTSSCYVINNIFVEESEPSDSLKIYPIPATDYLQIVSEFAMIRIVVIDQLGQLYFEQEIYKINQISVDVSLWCSGSYSLLVIDDQGNVRTRKVLIIDA